MEFRPPSKQKWIKSNVWNKTVPKGNGKCHSCRGSGQWGGMCVSCHGSGKCYNCKGTGLTKEGYHCPQCENNQDYPGPTQLYIMY